MSQVDKQRVIAEWLARRKDEDLKGALLACLDCGLVVTRPLAS